MPNRKGRINTHIPTYNYTHTQLIPSVCFSCLAVVQQWNTVTGEMLAAVYLLNVLRVRACKNECFHFWKIELHNVLQLPFTHRGIKKLTDTDTDADVLYIYIYTLNDDNVE